MDTIRDFNSLKMLSKKGIVVLHSHTGKKVTTPFGAKITAYYVEDVNPNKEGYFAKYVSGSFYPYVAYRRHVVP